MNYTSDQMEYLGQPSLRQHQANTVELEAAYERIDKLTKVLRHAQEALFWHHGEEFEMDGHRIGPLIEAVLS